MSKPQAARIAILGAGIAGASAARRLTDQGIAVHVYDKARRAGGRAATRLRSDAHYDHGAQYFTGRDPRFLAQIDAWQDAGWVALWQPRLVAIDATGRRSVLGHEQRFVALPAMNHLAAAMLADIDLRLSQRVQRVQRLDSGWWLSVAEQTHGPYAALICTLPAPQAAELLRGESLAGAVAAVAFTPCWALMVEFAEPLPVDFDAAFVNHGVLSWLARDSSKPGRPLAERWLIHAGAAYSQAHLEDEQVVAGDLLQAFFAAIDCPARAPIFSATHRWRYALAQPALELGALVDPMRQLAVGGDWCHGSRIEGAWLSGQRLADQVQDWV